jgi:hypothetical protein
MVLPTTKQGEFQGSIERSTAVDLKPVSENSIRTWAHWRALSHAWRRSMLSQFTLGRTRDPVSRAVFRHDEIMHSRVARKLVIATTRWSSVGHGLCSVARFGVYATLRRRGKRKLNGVPSEAAGLIDAGPRLPVGVADAEALGRLVDRPGQREAAGRVRKDCYSTPSTIRKSRTAPCQVPSTPRGSGTAIGGSRVL